MKKNTIQRFAMLALSAAVVFGAVQMPIPSQAAGPEYNTYQVDISELYDDQNFIYFGDYNHAINTVGYPSSVTAIQYEGVKKPILWRVAESTGSNAILYSQRVLDFKQYHATIASNWDDSTLRDWLNGTGSTEFPSNFSSQEKLAIVPTQVTTTPDGGGVPETTTDNFYLPHSKMVSGATGWVQWDAGDVQTPGAHEFTDSFSYSSASAQTEAMARLMDSVTTDTVRYWTRTTNSSVPANANYVDRDGVINLTGQGAYYGVRPVFEMNFNNVLFASELKQTPNLSTQTASNPANGYQDGGELTSDPSRKTFKLTMLDAGLTDLTTGSFSYDTDDTLVHGGTISLNTNEVLHLTSATPLNFGEYFVAKIVNSGNETVRYITGDDTGIDLEAFNNYISGTMAGGLNTGLYTGYIWIQKDGGSSSNLGGEPMVFDINVENDNTAPILSNPKAGRLDQATTATPQFTISGDSTGKYYYLLKEATDTPPTAQDVITGGNPKQTFSASGEQTLPTQNGLVANTDYVMYVVAKDAVRNPTAVFAIPMPSTPLPVNQAPVALSPVPTQNVVEGMTTTFVASDVAVDPDGDPITITMRNNTLTNSGVATVSLSGGVVTVTGVGSGSTTVDVKVEDTLGESITFSVPISVQGISNTPSVSPAGAVTLNQGGTQSLLVEFGLGAALATSADITSDDTSVVTVDLANLTSTGYIQLTGVSTGTANITVDFDNGTTVIVIPVSVISTSTPVVPGATYYTVNYSATGSGSVSASSTAAGNLNDGDSVIANDMVQFTASPNSGYTLSHWTYNGTPAGSNNPISFAATENMNLVAVFSPVSSGGGSGSGGSSSGGGSGGSSGGLISGGSGGGSSSGGGGGGSSSGGSSNSDKNVNWNTGTTSNSSKGQVVLGSVNTASAFVVDQPRATQSLQSKTAQNTSYARIQYQGPIRVLLTGARTFQTTRVYFDTMKGNAVDVRVSVDNPSLFTTEMMLSGYTTGDKVNAVQKLFNSWFKNKIAVIHLDQTQPWGQTVEIAARINWTDMDVNQLYFYSYNTVSNQYTQISAANPWIDTNGYLHFDTNLAGDIIISEGPLVRK